MKNNFVWIVLVVVVGAGTFFGGMKYQQSRKVIPRGFAEMQQRGLGQGQAQRQGQQNNLRNGFSPVSGEIISTDSGSLTIKTQDGGSKIVIISDSTKINKTSEGGRSDLKAGEQVMVIGTTNTDGSVTAQNVQLNPVLRGMPTPEPTK